MFFKTEKTDRLNKLKDRLKTLNGHLTKRGPLKKKKTKKNNNNNIIKGSFKKCKYSLKEQVSSVGSVEN